MTSMVSCSSARAPAAPRHDLNKNQAGTAAAAAAAKTSNITELQKKPGFEKYGVDDLTKIAFEAPNRLHCTRAAVDPRMFVIFAGGR